MTDFVGMSQFGHWRDCTGYRQIRDVYQPPVYINDDWYAAGTQAQLESEQQYMRNAAKDAWKSAQSSELAKSSLMWPYYAYEQRLASPFVLGGATAALIAPLYDPQIGVGAALLVGYVLGAATFYAQNRTVRRQPQDRSDETKGVFIHPTSSQK